MAVNSVLKVSISYSVGFFNMSKNLTTWGRRLYFTYEFKHSRGDGFSRTINVLSTSFFGGEVKPDTPCRKALRHVKQVASMNKSIS
jgi:hypothetical protein